MLSLEATNNVDPDALTIHREHPRQVSFGYGIHLCLGLALARLEAKVAFDAILDRYSNMRLAEQEVDWQMGSLVRGMEQVLPDNEQF
jgi:cytochrome P450